jgi:arylsulfatase A-like enzyme
VRLASKFLEKVETYLVRGGILPDDALLVLVADHGERFYEHGTWEHGEPDVYNEVTKIPMMIRGEGVRKGVYQTKAQLADVYPTIMDWLGDEKSEFMVGHSLIDHSESNLEILQKRAIYTDGVRRRFQYSYITGDIKVILDGEDVEIFDLREDPLEMEDLSSEDTYRRDIQAAKHFRDAFQVSAIEEQRTISADEIEKLKSLGYID